MPYYYLETQHELARVLSNIERATYSPLVELAIEAWITPEPVPFASRQSGTHAVLGVGQRWGKLWDCAWFHFTGTVPEQAIHQTTVLLIDLSGEGCVVDKDGCPLLGLTTVSSEFDLKLGRPGKRVVPLAASSDTVDLWVDAGCNDLFGKYQDSGTIKSAHIALYHRELDQLYHDFAVLHELMLQLSSDTARYHRIMAALHRATQELTAYTEDEAVRARAHLSGELARTGGTPSLQISAIGHAHIDLAWLWPIRETIRKGARSFATVLAMMERYPDYIFGASQPQLYVWMKEYYPQLYDKIRARIAEGRWETQGAMWVEPDTNISGGEALVRQLLYGKRYFRQEFGKDVKMVWLPDVFGYTAALPQLLRKAGVDYFLTTKLSWSEYNVFPHHTFFWQGLDGSRVLVHMPPEGTYNSSAAPRAVVEVERAFADKVASEHCALLFGIGDGGGGPGVEHLERLAREKNLAGLAPVTQEFMETFFQRIEQDSHAYKTWTGELYLEKHQGTYTSQARNKRYNRKIELALRDLEFFATLAMIRTHHNYPTAELEAIWQEVLLYQFHDILPGSSITRVYDESLARYEQLFTRTQQLLSEAQAAFTDSSSYTIFNTLPWTRSAWLSIENQWRYVTAPAMGYAKIDVHETSGDGENTPVSSRLAASTTRLENDLLSLTFAADGPLQSVFDKEHEREVLEPGTYANRLALYHDDGDAWDFPIGYAERAPNYFQLKEVTAYLDGPQAVAEQSYHYGQSTLKQRIVLTAGSRRIDFVTEVDWHENNTMLRTSFPVAISATEATCDIQFGSLKRAVHRNTRWDMAKYEICAHKWVDLSQWDYGVALLNDCKYGYNVLANVLDLNLLRSPAYPDPQADRAHHTFTYALYPHAGNHIVGNVVQEGYELNVPLRAVMGESAPQQNPTGLAFAKIESANVIIEAVKKAEDSDDVILRLYESSGATTSTTLTLDMDFSAVWQVNLLEEREAQVKSRQKTVELVLQPYEILTLLVQRT